MANMRFANTHNMVVFLSKSDASAGFYQIVDFLNTQAVILQDLRLDDADGMECLPNEEIFIELARMGYEKPPPKLTFYKGRKDDDNAAIKEVSAAEPTVFDDEEENIDWNVVVEQMQEKYLNNIRKYPSLKRKPISVAQARKNMIVYLKNMVGYKMEHFKGMTYDKESFKKLKAVEVLGSHSTQDTPNDDPKEMSEEDVKNMLEIIPVTEFKVEALQ
nr:hypothetical protein [Tanacetum cinerariifolium]